MTPATRAKLATLGQVRKNAQKTVTTTTTELRPVVIKAISEGGTEVEIARLTGLSRSTVRGWIGKPNKPRV
jgi:DNA-binding NarL/FixJ family response regulator